VVADTKIDIKSLQFHELEATIHDLGGPSYRAAQVADWVYKKRTDSFEKMTDLPLELRARLADEFSFDRMQVVRVLDSKASGEFSKEFSKRPARDGMPDSHSRNGVGNGRNEAHGSSPSTTRKFLFQLTDRNLIESVLIPASPALYGSRSDRRTICVSTQVGCAYGCKFCASGLEGLTRNLRVNEIVDQIIAVERESGERIDNVVFMGMGEPLANFDNVIRAIRIMNAPWGLAIGARHITVSTSGLAPQIRKLADEPLQIRIAISLHGPTDQVRDQIMPINRRYNIETLLSACDYYVSLKKQLLTFEYILIDGVNDADAHAHLVARQARRLSAKVNLIPYNNVDGLSWTRPPRHRQEKFLSILRAEGVRATLRREKGHDIDAACGQLRLQTKNVAQVSSSLGE
jgi:23S rRNA (adenine2503-C2)-methyltransferase